MPIFRSFHRCISGFPAGSCACANLCRWCSGPSTPPLAPEQRQPTAPTGSFAAARTSPSLDLGLNFAAMDFEAVARATQSAIARERGSVYTTSPREEELDARLGSEAQKKTSTSSLQTTPPSTIASTALSDEAGTSMGNNTVAAHPRLSAHQEVDPDLSRSMPPRQGVPPSKGRLNGGPSGRQSLYEMLQACVDGGHWARALQIFNTAVDQACKQVLVSGKGSSSATNPGKGTSDREAECFAALRKMRVAAPPSNLRDRAAAASRSNSFKNWRGVMRWGGQHYFLLWKCLLEAERVDELQRVWHVMQQTGFVEFDLEQRTVNSLMTLLRRISSSAEQTLVNTIIPNAAASASAVSHGKAVRRDLMKALEQAAGERNLKLAGANQRTLEGIRITEALQRVEAINADPTEDGDGTTPAIITASGQLTPGPAVPAIEVGDFNSLIRRSRSTEATERILRMMDKLQIAKGAVTYASLIAALHNPQYVLAGHTAEEVAAHQLANNSHPPQTPTEAMEDETPLEVTTEVVASAPMTPAQDLATCKAAYEAYKLERIEASMAIFTSCPVAHRTADVFNELLYLLRAKAQWGAFNAVLRQFRGNAVVSEGEWPENLPPNDSSKSGRSPVAPQAILPPNWMTPPNAKTYEILLQRARYVHQWPIMWKLYEEMMHLGVRGTNRVYEVLLLEARLHPPPTVERCHHNGSLDASSQFQLQLYEELRRNGGDVRSLRGTLNIVNAWSNARVKGPRWS